MSKIIKETDGKLVVNTGVEVYGSDDFCNVVEFKLLSNSTTLVVTEACDHYFSASLNKQEVEELIKQLTILKDQMVNEESVDVGEVIEHPVYNKLVDKFMEVN